MIKLHGSGYGDLGSTVYVFKLFRTAYLAACVGNNSLILPTAPYKICGIWCTVSQCMLSKKKQEIKFACIMLQSPRMSLIFPVTTSGFFVVGLRELPGTVESSVPRVTDAQPARYVNGGEYPDEENHPAEYTVTSNVYTANQSFCENAVCQNGGTCVEADNGAMFWCKCDLYHFGPLCERGEYCRKPPPLPSASPLPKSPQPKLLPPLPLAAPPAPPLLHPYHHHHCHRHYF